MTDRKYPKLDPSTISDKCFKALAEWLPVQSEIEENNRSMIAHQIIEYTPRFLYDFFDDKEIYISINKDYDKFGWSVRHGNITTVNFASDRIEAEQEAFKEAFNILNKNL